MKGSNVKLGMRVNMFLSMGSSELQESSSITWFGFKLASMFLRVWLRFQNDIRPHEARYIYIYTYNKYILRGLMKIFDPTELHTCELRESTWLLGYVGTYLFLKVGVSPLTNLDWFMMWSKNCWVFSGSANLQTLQKNALEFEIRFLHVPNQRKTNLDFKR